DPPQFPGGKFDLILANPPYILESQRKDMRPNVLDHEPSLALFVSDEDPLVFYKAIARWAKALLSEMGTGIVEINEALGLETSAVFLAAGFRRVEIIRDFSEKNRFVVFS
ncbi:MAG: peptide chain release factor N(5)-glutamine methyltransferase, partial [Bacteroidales bacterium]|nr:peptide chain release factor N(5)-glutamine methyltransferase [Bacteroidales bacterium]